MKCPECGQWNRASMPHCISCGAPLNIDAASRLDWKDGLKDDQRPTAYLRADEFGQVIDTRDPRDELAQEMQKLKQRKAKGAELQRQLRQSAESRQNPGIVVEEEAVAQSPGSSQSSSSLRLRRVSPEADSIRREQETRHRVRFLGEAGVYVESRTYDPVLTERFEPAPPSRTITSRVPLTLPSRLKRRKMIVRTLVSLLLIAVLGTGGYFAWQTISARRQSEKVSNAIITAGMQDEVAAHQILIPGEEGSSIYIRELHASYTVSEGYATVVVADHTWYDNIDGSLDETMEVTLSPFLKTATGRQVPLDPIHYTISIPLSRVELDSPDSLRTTVSTTMSAIRIVVQPGSKVTVNGDDYSDTVSSVTGEMTYNAIVQPKGDNEYEFVVRSQYCRENRLTVVLYREPQEIPLDLDAGTFGSTDQNWMKVKATTLPGAYVNVSTPHSDLNITDLDSTGKFSFNAVFDKIGYNTISITASYPGKKPSTVEHTVYYVPPRDEYTTKAWPLSASGYSELLSNMTVRAKQNQVYVVMGVVQRFISLKPQQAVINTSEDGKSQPVVVQNYSKETWELGNYYRIYADADSMYGGMPVLNGRYTYKK